MYIPVYLPRYDEIRLVFPYNELNIAGLMVQNLLMLSKNEGCDIPSDIEIAFKNAIESEERLCLNFGREYREFAIRIIEAVIESHENEDENEDAKPLKEFLEDIEVFERQYLH
ncbi:MAG TPA: hypothetical protein ENI66_01180 [Candidatus Yonathbacteria bacterium]|nr:hypothetical protein [Candidatus Yonathbacteria bacterium]